MVHDNNTGKPRGYAFIEYEDEADMHGKLSFFYRTKNTVKTLSIYLKVKFLADKLCKIKNIISQFNIFYIEFRKDYTYTSHIIKQVLKQIS